MAKKPSIDMSGLETFALDQAEAQEQTQAPTPAQAVSDGRPLEIPLGDIIEDPHQPRTIFEEQSLNELSASIALFGVLMPISVRQNPAGGYIINSGARRFRASGIANKKTIPAFIQGEYDKYGQMAENIHRDNLKPLEIASFISEEVKTGKKKGDIAKALGKSPAFVSQFLKLASGPDWIKDLSARGVCSDVTTLTELIKVAEGGSVNDLEQIVSGMETISRADVQNLTKPAPAPQEVSLSTTPENPADFGSQGADVSAPADPPEHSTFADANSTSEDTGSGEEKTKAPKEAKEPNLDKAVYIGGRKGYLQTRQVEVWWDDTGSFEKIPLKDLPPESLED